MLQDATGSSPGVMTLLDIGAGRGELITLLRRTLSVKASACDYHVERFALPDVEIRQLNLNQERLPYADASFDIVTCSEVVEHLENYRDLFRQVNRILKPGGVFVVTTPNVLNLKSRMRYFFTGFASLFGPLPVKNQNFASSSYMSRRTFDDAGEFALRYPAYNSKLRSAPWVLISSTRAPVVFAS